MSSSKQTIGEEHVDRILTSVLMSLLNVFWMYFLIVHLICVVCFYCSVYLKIKMHALHDCLKVDT